MYKQYLIHLLHNRELVVQTSYLQRMTLRQIDVFLAVCQQLSYSRAAEQLALTQPAVSAQIRSLEGLIKQPLFDYVGRQLYLTPAGELLQRAARDLQQRLVNLEIELTELHGKLQGKLSIVAESSADTLIPAYINQFCQQHPDAEISLQVENHQNLIKRLQDNLHDLAILTMVPSDQGLHYTPFAEHQLLAVAASDHPLAQRDRVTLPELLAQRLLLREAGSGSRKVLEEHCLQQSCVIRHARQLGSNQAIRHSLPGSRDCAVLPRSIAQQGIADGTLRELAVENFPIRRSWCSAYQRGKHLSPLATAFLHFLHQARNDHATD